MNRFVYHIMMVSLGLITTTANALPTGSLNYSGRLGGTVDASRSAMNHSANSQMSYTGKRGNSVSAQSQSQLNGNTLSYGGSVSTSTGRGINSQGSAVLSQNGISGSNSTSTNSGYSASSSYQVGRTDSGQLTGSGTATTASGYSATVTGTGDQSGGSVNISTSTGKNKTVTYGDQRP